MLKSATFETSKRKRVMYYALTGVIAIIIHVIVNNDIIAKRGSSVASVTSEYRQYLNAVLAFYVADALWGLLTAAGWKNLLFIDTFAYYATAAFTVILWGRYVVNYLHLKRKFIRALLIIGFSLVFIDVLLLLVNLFHPFIFNNDGSGNSSGNFYSLVLMLTQLPVFSIIAAQSFAVARKTQGRASKRNFSIGMFGVELIPTVILQYLFPQMPIYSCGLLIGTCIMHVFVQEDEKSEFRKKLENEEERLRENNDIITNAGYGIWKIKIRPDGNNIMLANDKLKEIFGVSDMKLSPEELYTFYHSRIMVDAQEIVERDYDSMIKGNINSRIVEWNHPVKGKVFLEAGGAGYTSQNGEFFISGYCADITERKKSEIRNNHIINSLARSYEQINYITMSKGIYTGSSQSYDVSDEHPALKSIQASGNVYDAIEYACDNLVAPEYKSEIRAFSDLSTVNERMALTHVLSTQFKNYNEVWYEWSYIVADRTPDNSIKHLIWAVRKIEDEKQAEMRKQKILEENIAANNAKTIFLQNMSHEIRTPLNAMFGFAQLLGMPDGSWTEEERALYNSHVLNSYYMMDMLIGDIIDVADAEHGNYQIQITDVPVNDICRKALQSCEYRKPGAVEMQFTSDLPEEYMIKTDGRRVQQVLINYLTNACKHTKEGSILLSCSSTQKPGKIVFAVTDTGDGVPADKADVIFNRFTKLNQFVQGSGLGLNICQMIAEKLDGEVYLDNNYKGGARFVFEINDTKV